MLIRSRSVDRDRRRRPGAARAAPPAALGRARRDRGVRAARRPAVAAPGHARRQLLRAHGLERGQGALPAERARQDPRPQGRAARRQPPGVQHLRDAEAARRRASAGRARAHARPRPTTRSRRSTSGSRSARSAIRRAPMLVLEDQGRDRAALVEQARARLPGVEVRHEPYRYYPQGDLAAHLDRLHDADDRRRGRRARRRRATTRASWSAATASSRRGRTTCAARRASSASRSTRAASASTTRPPRR